MLIEEMERLLEVLDTEIENNCMQVGKLLEISDKLDSIIEEYNKVIPQESRR